MKSIVLSAAAVVMMVLAGCGSPTDDAIDDLDAIVNRMSEVTKGKTAAEVQALPEFTELQTETRDVEARIEKHKADFTPEQNARIAAILAKAQAAGEQMK